MFVRSSPPSANTLEVSLFGTGIGESIALHAGDGEWVFVDCCRPNKQDEPLNLAYIRSLGVDPIVSVKAIVASHWHDDHVDGLSELIVKCPNARLVFSQALETDEFQNMVGCFVDPTISFDREKSGVREMGQSLLTLLRRKKEAPEIYQPPERTQADHRIFRKGDCEIVSLSPSPGSIQNATEEIAALWYALEKEARGGNGPRPARAGIPCPERNHNAVALWVKWGERRILLGADLEEEGQSLLGWQAVLSCRQFPDSVAGVFKIPHHGSPNGNYEPTWQKIIDPNNPISILTAYSRGRTPRPAPEDLERIKRKSSELYYTSLPRMTANKYDRSVERTISGITRWRRKLGRTPGHIQVRWEADSTPVVQFAGAAGKF